MNTFFRMMLQSCLVVAASWACHVHAESGSYRVEILVFRYTQSQELPEPHLPMSHFPQSWDPPASIGRRIPEDPAFLSARSDLMQEVWRKLARDPDYEPLLFRSWEQSRIDYHPPIRIHDLEVLHERLDLDSGRNYIDLEAPDPLEPYKNLYFQLDGTVQLRRSRFLHLDLNLEFREELFEPESGMSGEFANDESVSGQPMASDPAMVLTLPAESSDRVSESPFQALPAPLPEPIRVEFEPVPGALRHLLSQSRQIKTQELNYFDSPYLGVLARVTATIGE